MRKTCDRSPLGIVAAVGELIAAFPSPKLEEAYRVEVTLLPDTVVVEVGRSPLECSSHSDETKRLAGICECRGVVQTPQDWARPPRHSGGR